MSPECFFHGVWLLSLRFDSQALGTFSFSSYKLFGYCSFFWLLLILYFFLYPPCIPGHGAF